MRGCKISTSDFGPYPNRKQIRRLVIALSRLTRWGLRTVRGMTWQEICEWLEEAAAFEREIHRA